MFNRFDDRNGQAFKHVIERERPGGREHCGLRLPLPIYHGGLPLGVLVDSGPVTRGKDYNMSTLICAGDNVPVLLLVEVGLAGRSYFAHASSAV